MDESTSESDKLRGLIALLVVMQHELLRAYWIERQERVAAEQAATFARKDLKILRHRVKLLKRDLGLIMQVIWVDDDNKNLSSDQCRDILNKVARFCTPYVDLLNKRK